MNFGTNINMIDENEKIGCGLVVEGEMSEEDIERLKAEYIEHRAKMDDALSALGNFLADTANGAVTDKKWLEDRAIDDYRQRLGIKTSIDEYQGKSQASYNLTAIKCNAAKSRLSDILFPLSGKNYTIAPDAELHGDNLEQVEQGSQVLEDKIDDYLDACDYDHEGRKTISDCVDFGCGIVEGPIPSATLKKKWVQGDGSNTLEVSIDTSSPTTEYVSWWDYFPDLSVAEHKDCSYEFRRRYMASVDLDMLTYREDFNQQAIKDMLARGGDAEEPYHLQQLRDESLPAFTSDTWCIFSGYIRVPAKYIRAIYESESERFEIEANDYGVNQFDDTETDIECIVWFSSTGDLLKIVPNPYALQKRGFHVVCYDRDTACFMASRGLPRLMARQQLQINNLLRRIDDNSSLASVPIIVYDPEVIEPVPTKPGRRLPENEDYIMRGGMTWRLKRPGVIIDQALRLIKIPSNTGELLAILKMVEQQADEVTMLPDILAGEQSATMTKTWHGIELLANNALIIQKRVEKDWSDNITVPMIDAYVDYVLKFKPIQGVSGSFVVNVKGSAGLLLKESQAKNWMNAIEISRNIPEFSQRTDWAELHKKVLGALQIDYEAITLSDEEIQQRQQQPQGPNIEEEKINAMHESNSIRKYIADKGFEKELVKLQAEQMKDNAEMSDRDKARQFNMLADERKIILDTKAKEHLMAQEFKVESTGLSRI